MSRHDEQRVAPRQQPYSIEGVEATGVVEVPGAKLAVVRLADGNPLSLRQSLPVGW